MARTTARKSAAKPAAKPAAKRAAKRATPRSRGPKADRPYMPGYGVLGPKDGAGTLPWSWARDRLAQSWNFFIVTSRPNRAPHAQAVWGVMVGDVFYFSTSPTSAKARNLARDPRCTVTIDVGGPSRDETVVLEGTARIERKPAAIKKFIAAYEPKYSFKLDPIPGDVYAVDPHVVIGIGEEPFAETATRWTFPR